MTELPIKTRQSAIRLALLFTALLVFLIACDTTPPATDIKPEVTLTIDKTALPDGGDEVTLTARITRGKATSVTFRADTGLEIPPVTTPNAAGEFVTKVNVTQTTNFTAQATGAAGTGAATGAKTVTVAPPSPDNDPKAPSTTAALKGFEGIDIVVGTPTGLAVTYTQIPGVSGAIVGQVQAETITTSQGTVTIKEGADKLEFTYTPNPGATEADSFEYTVVKTGRSEKGKIDILLEDISSASFQIADSLADINDTNKQNIFLANDVTCTASPCVRLENNQKLIGVGSLMVDGVTVTNASTVKPKIIANISGTRQPGVPACSFNPPEPCLETVVVDLADNVTIEGIELAKAGEGYFVGFKGESDNNDTNVNTLSGTISLKNITMNGSSGKPIYIKYGQGTRYGNYNLIIENFDLNDANDTVVIGNPKTLVFKNSTIELVQPFGDNVGINIDESVGATITIENVDVEMESTRYKLDITPGLNAAPFIIESRNGVSSELSVKDCDITIDEILASDVYSFKVRANDTSDLEIVDSTNNTAPRGVDYEGDIQGTIQFN